MSYVIVSDSSSNLFSLPGVNYTTVPMKILASKEYVDTPDVDLKEMVADLKSIKGKTGSSCPNVQEWLDAFGDADAVYGVTITRNLSGSYNAAHQAAQLYMDEHPGKKAYIFDSFSAGPELAMIADKIAEQVKLGADFETVVEKVEEYQSNCHTLFCLESLANLAKNGRVKPAVAKIAGVLGIRLIGYAKEGRIEALHKVRGHKKSMQTVVQTMEEWGFRDGGLIRVSHCFAETQAADLKALVMEKWPNARFVLEHTGALCSYYAEVGGLILGFEGSFNSENHPGLFK